MALHGITHSDIKILILASERNMQLSFYFQHEQTHISDVHLDIQVCSYRYRVSNSRCKIGFPKNICLSVSDNIFQKKS